MLRFLSGKEEWLSWAYLARWTIVLLATLPLARSLQQSIDRFAGKWIYIVLVGLLIALYLAVSARYVMRATHVRSANIIWFAAVSAIVMGITATARTPIEGLHFIQYGVLGLLAYRALSHRIHDFGVYLSATLIATIVGTIDEAVQWILPNRVWDIRDILFNLSGSLMVQFAIGLGFRPPQVAPRLSYSSFRRLCWLGTAALVFLGASLLNTPQRIAWYSEKSPAAAWRLADAGVMAEYGFMHVVPGLGSFRSRFSLADLRNYDEEVGSRIGPQLDQLRADGGYIQFLREHRSRLDPVAHEAAVHLARRNYYRG